MSLTLRSRLSTRENALNFVRLILALIVIFAHSWLLGGFDGGPEIDFGAWAVHGFFAISGYLIAGSRMRLGIREYLVHRALRIFPAFWVVLMGVAFVVAPLTSLLMNWDYSAKNAASYVIKNAGLYIFQTKIFDTLGGLPFPWFWNGSLWTLFYEFAAYVLAALVLTPLAFRRHPVATISALLIIATAAQFMLVGILGIESDFALKTLRLAPYFLAGMLIYFISDRISLRLWTFFASVGAFVILAVFGLADYFGQLPLSFAVLWLGAQLPIRVGVENDISYGVYIWAWPMQIVALCLGAGALGAPLAGLCALLLTLPLAWLSWRYIERPAMALRRRIPRRWYGDAADPLMSQTRHDQG